MWRWCRCTSACNTFLSQALLSVVRLVEVLLTWLTSSSCPALPLEMVYQSAEVLCEVFALCSEVAFATVTKGIILEKLLSAETCGTDVLLNVSRLSFEKSHELRVEVSCKGSKNSMHCSLQDIPKHYFTATLAITHFKVRSENALFPATPWLSFASRVHVLRSLGGTHDPLRPRPQIPIQAQRRIPVNQWRL